MKSFSKIFIRALLALYFIFVFVACKQLGDPDPDGPYAPGLGGPGGTSVLSGGNNTSSKLPIFDINNLPPVSTWNDFGEIVPLPNPFYMADGAKVASESQWPARREELKKTIEYYWSGYYPPPPTRVEISGPGATGAGTVTITIFANGKIASLDAVITIPATAPNNQAPGVVNKVPVLVLDYVMQLYTNFRDIFTNNGYATISFSSMTSNTNTIAHQLWGDYPTPLTTASALVQDAWLIARLIDAIELGAGGGFIDPEKFVMTGLSRWGKEALFAGAFSQSLNGTKLAAVMPIVSGAGGIPVERMISHTTTKRSLYYLSLDSYDSAPLIMVVPPDTPNAIMLPINNGIQSKSQCRDEEPAWFSQIFQRFDDTHPEWRTNYYRDLTGYGILGTTPFDSHFLTSMVAPRGLFIVDVFGNNWSNPEGEYMTYLATKEVYEFINADKNIGIRIYDWPHGAPARAFYDFVDFCNQYFNRLDSGLNYTRLKDSSIDPAGSIVPVAPANGSIFYDTDPKQGEAHIITWFDPRTRDPDGYMEYTKLNWANPKKAAGSSVAAQVKAYFDAHPAEILPNSIFLPEEL
ncbi:hypothetical protein AGMMS50293_26330 [Spirochaetia bacterium]|nr:hypothetical protein AGMMS50293_26330 [Spirochaetia bacterium]